MNAFTLMNYGILFDILGDTTIGRFISDFWEKKPLFISQTNRSPFILDREVVENMISMPSLAYPYIDILSEGKRTGDILSPVNNKTAILPTGPNNILANNINKQYNIGNTIILQKAHLLQKNFHKLIRELENEILMKLSANIYVSPKYSFGFPPHYDTHDVFVFQLHGSKRWRIFDSPKLLPNSTSPFVIEENRNYLAEQPTMEIDLKKGNALYIPRGWVHNAFTLNSESIHLTLGLFRTLNPTTPSLKTAYYVGSKKIDLKKICIPLNTMYEINELWADNFGYDDFFNNKIQPPNLRGTTYIEINQNFRYKVRTTPSHLEIETNNEILQIPNRAKHALFNLIYNEKCKVSEISSSLHDLTKLYIAKKFYEIGLIKICSECNIAHQQNEIDWTHDFYFDITEDGEIINPTTYDATPTQEKRIISAIIDDLINYTNRNIISIYLRGSLAIPNEAHKTSDIDIIIITSDKKSTDLVNIRLKKTQHSDRLDYCVYDVTKLDSNEELKFIIKTQSVLIYGLELKGEIPTQYLDNKICYNLNGINVKLARFKNSLKISQATDTTKICASVMKFLLRSAFEMVMLREKKFTRNILTCYKEILKYYIEDEILFLQILSLAINPIDDKNTIIQVISRFSTWHKKVCIY